MFFEHQPAIVCHNHDDVESEFKHEWRIAPRDTLHYTRLGEQPKRTEEKRTDDSIMDGERIHRKTKQKTAFISAKHSKWMVTTHFGSLKHTHKFEAPKMYAKEPSPSDLTLFLSLSPSLIRQLTNERKKNNKQKKRTTKESTRSIEKE